ncbi:MAG: TonB-dependent receptor [Candidatus Omnitrophica bacterium]|nr:TonB-dependent receptor [Candidatus Omnitrophota bacterium]
MNRRNLVFIAGLILVMVFGGSALAEEYELDKIVVSASRSKQKYKETTRSLDIVDSEDIGSGNIDDVADALDYASGAQVLSYGGIGAQKTLRIRGATDNQTLILLDGVSLNNSRHGQANLAKIPLDMIDRVEIVRGPASNLYGSSAVGGVANIITKEPDKKQHTYIRSEFGTFRTNINTLYNSGTFGKLGYIVSGTRKTSQGHRDNSKYRANIQAFKAVYDINETNKLTVHTGAHYEKHGIPGKVNAQDLDDEQIDKSNYTQILWDSEVDDTLNFTIKSYYNFDRIEFIEKRDPLNKNAANDKARGFDGHIEKRFSDRYKFLLGLNRQKNLLNSSSSGKHDYRLLGIYLNNTFTLSDDFNIEASLRQDDYSNFGEKLMPSFSVSYWLNDSVKLHSFAGRSFRVPTFNDLYYPAAGIYEGNPNLQPEVGWSGEMGLQKWLSNGHFIEVVYFRNDTDKLINWAEGSGGVWTPTNINSAMIEGLELKAVFPLFFDLTGDVSYNYLRSKDKDTDKYLTNRPKHKVDMFITADDVWGWEVKLGGQFVSNRFTKTNNSDYLDHFFVMSVDASRQLIKNIEYTLSIDNMLNRKYSQIQGYPMPGFSLRSGVKIEF